MEGYERVRRIGGGTYGEVVLYTCNKTGQHVAVKKIICTSVDDANIAINEAFQLHNHHHPNMVDCAGLFLEQTEAHGLKVCMVMPYFEAGDLAQFLNEHMSPSGAVPPNWLYIVVEILKQIASVLTYLHSHSFVHRDLKPQNILVSTQAKPAASSAVRTRSDGVPTVQVTDFGMLKRLDESLLRTQCGTPAYMSPEQVRGEYNAAVDIWAFGCIAFQMLAMQAPKVMYMELFTRHSDGFVAWTRSCLEARKVAPPWLVDLTLSMLEADAAQRPVAQVAYDILCSHQAEQDRPLRGVEQRDAGATGRAAVAHDARALIAFPAPQLDCMTKANVALSTEKFERGWSPLVTAACAGDPSLCLDLIRLGADVEAVDASQRTVLHHIADSRAKRTPHCAGIVLDAAPQGFVLRQDKYRQTALHIAANNRHNVEPNGVCRPAGAIMKVLLESLLQMKDRAASAASVDEIDCWGRTALHFAAGRGCQPCCRNLIANGADVLIQEKKYGHTAADIAGRSGFTELERSLRAKMAQVATSQVPRTLDAFLANSADSSDTLGDTRGSSSNALMASPVPVPTPNAEPAAAPLAESFRAISLGTFSGNQCSPFQVPARNSPFQPPSRSSPFQPPSRNSPSTAVSQQVSSSPSTAAAALSVGAPAQPPRSSPTGAPAQPPRSSPTGASAQPPRSSPTGAPAQPPRSSPTGAPAQPPRSSPTGAPAQPPRSSPTGTA